MYFVLFGINIYTSFKELVLDLKKYTMPTKTKYLLNLVSG